ncbi:MULTISPECIES: hypothetical protein [Pseudomonas]|jgi:hypothetical protein|nr:MULTISPECIES: hypothetical protein [Pseudomonas]SFU06931.1 hypothetical protein SAMN05216264_11052 [Pseudomonas marincola]
MNRFAAIASLLAASAFTTSVSAESQRQLDKARASSVKTQPASEAARP